MSSFVACSRGHRNPSSHRFCQECGEQLGAQPSGARVGQRVGDRYRIVAKLGRGGFGQTYLAEDSHRFEERCVLKEFAPVDQSPKALKKAKQLFEREAAILYQLQHPQIPRFREWFVAPEGRSLFLVQDYVAGQTYLARLRERQRRGKTFQEAEIVEFLQQTLPILDYIHRQGVIHRDLSPDNLILRDSDQRPVLIDFGGVRQISAMPVLPLGLPGANSRTGTPTLLGKPGYAPDEQLRLGKVSPSSDLYALAVTALVLLIGKEPQDFYDPNTRQFHWRQQVQLNPALAKILEQMLAPHPGDRYGAAADVLKALTATLPNSAHSGIKTYVVRIAAHSTVLLRRSGWNLQQVLAQGWGSLKALKPLQPLQLLQPLQPLKPLALVLILGLVGTGLGWWAIRTWVLNLRPWIVPPAGTATPTPGFSPEEESRKNQLFDRLEQLQLDPGFFHRLTNEAFYLQYPEQRGRLLTAGPEDASWRAAWDQTGLQVLDAVAPLSREVRDRLGSYHRQDFSRLESQLQQRKRDRQQFFAAVDAEFYRRLPMYREQDLTTTVGFQLWYALAVEQLRR